jgi:heptosyltransferase II
VPSTAVIQVKRGIGDVVWHLPFIRAIAAKEPEGAVTFLTLPSTRAKELLQAEPSVGGVIYFEHHGSEILRGFLLARLVALMRARSFKRIWILDRTLRPALAAKMAGIPERFGPGDGPQRWLITNNGIEARHFRSIVTDWLRVFLESMNVPVPTTEPDLKLPPALLASIGERFAAMARPWTVLALGGSHPEKDWPDAHSAAFLDTLRRRTAGTVFLIGGADNAARAQALIERSAGATAVNACGLSIVEAAALLRLADLFVGPDSGPMNLAAAGATPAFGLFGSTPVLDYSRFIHPIEPEGGKSVDGMRRITPAQVMARIEPYLAVSKNAM